MKIKLLKKVRKRYSIIRVDSDVLLNRYRSADNLLTLPYYYVWDTLASMGSGGKIGIVQTRKEAFDIIIKSVHNYYLLIIKPNDEIKIYYN